MGKRNKDSNIKGMKRKEPAKKVCQVFAYPNHSDIDKIITPTNPNPPIEKGKESFYRTKSKIKLLNLYNSTPNKDGFKRPDKPSRIEPNPR